MSCEQLAEVLIEAARGHEGMDDAQVRQHTSVCPDCAARFATERQTTTTLRTLAAQDADVSAPAHVEAALLAAFRAQASETKTTNAVVAPVGARAQRFAWLWASRPRFAVAAFACAVVVALLVVAALRLRPTPVRTPQMAGTQQAAPTRAPASSQDVNTPSASPRDESVRAMNTPPKRPAIVKRHLRSEVARAGRTRSVTPRDEQPAALGTVGEMVVFAPREETEDVTPFVPLVATGAPPLTSGQLVRVRVPRSALNALGLPINLARAGESVQADVLMGDDGFARAIRLVRQRGESF